MLYVIPFIILLAIAVLLKKREDPNKDKSKKSNATKNIARKANKRFDPPTPLAATESVSGDSESTTVIDDNFKQNIEKLIKARTFYSAEAKINQALNQDSSQHELYLYLVDIHLAQNDEFAIKQLVSYVRSLGLHDIADRAEEKQRNYVPDNVFAPEPVEEVEKVVEHSKPIENNQNANKAFDALIFDNQPTSFDTLESDLKSENKQPAELKTLDFFANDNATPQKPAEDQNTAEALVNIEPETQNDHVADIEFSFAENKAPITETSIAIEAEVQSDTQAEEPLSFTTQSLDFNLNQPAQIEVQAPEIQGEDFVFDEKTSSEATPLGSDTTFKLDVGTPAPISESSDALSNELEFNMDMPAVDGSAPLAASAITAQAAPEFLLDGANADTSSEFSFDLKPAEVESQQSFEITQNSVSTESLEFSSAPIQEDSISASDLSSDPLAQSFPELLQVDEVELDFQLAERYIQLGAFESAKVLLTQNESKYSDEQREHSENLLNGIAS